tara:strand:- start:1404 stop:1682 length:279 start_codon:yes stop_codon:yes gene_type:complete
MKIVESGSSNNKDFYQITYDRHWIDWEDPHKEHLASMGSKEFTHTVSRNLGEAIIDLLRESGDSTVDELTYRDFDTCYEYPSSIRGANRWLI